MITFRRGLGATSPYASQVATLAPQYNIPPSLAVAVMNAESSGNPNAVSSAGAIGLFQLMPATAAGLNVNPNDPTQNITGGLTYLQQLYTKYGDWDTALIAYNQGPGALAANGPYASSSAYASSILSAAGMDSSTSSPFSSTPNSSDSSVGADLSPSVNLFDSMPTFSLTGTSGVMLAAIAAGLLVLAFAFRD